MGTKGEMTPEEFDTQSAKFARMSPQVIATVRAVLVEGKGPTEVAKQFGVSKQAVQRSAARARALLQEMPVDWVFLQEWVPPELATEVRAKVAEKLKETRKSQGKAPSDAADPNERP